MPRVRSLTRGDVCIIRPSIAHHGRAISGGWFIKTDAGLVSLKDGTFFYNAECGGWECKRLASKHAISLRNVPDLAAGSS